MQYSRTGTGAALAALFLGTAFAATAPTQTVRVPGIGTPLSWTHTPLDYQLTQAGIVITAPGKTDRYSDPRGGHSQDNAPQLVFDDADSDFVFSTAVSHKFASKWDSGGLVVEADATHWFKFEFEGDYTGAHRVVSVVTTNDYSDDANSIEIASDSAWLEVAKTGDAFFLYASKDGKSWYLVRTFNFKHTGPLKVGLIAQCPQGQAATITFTDVKYSPARVKDIWKGQ